MELLIKKCVLTYVIISLSPIENLSNWTLIKEIYVARMQAQYIWSNFLVGYNLICFFYVKC